jgi:hypothetical protein
LRCADDNFDGQIQIARHLLNHRDLLRVLLSKIRAVGLKNIEQFGDDSGDAAKMAGAHRPFERLRDFLDIHIRLKIGWINFRVRRRKDQINRIRFEQGEVAL